MYPVIHISLPTYAVLAFIGGTVAMVFMFFRKEKYGVEFSDYIKMFAISLVSGFVGSRLVFIISRMPWLIVDFSVEHLVSTIIGGGLVFYGGLIGVLLGIAFYCKRKNIDCVNVYNMIAPAVPLFHTFGRIGCFMSGCCYGLELQKPWMLFDLIIFEQIPTQLIEALFEALLFVIIIILQRKNKANDYLKIYMIAYAIFRFIIEFFRGDDIRGFYFGISTSQLIAVAILIFYLVVGIKKRVRCFKRDVAE